MFSVCISRWLDVENGMLRGQHNIMPLDLVIFCAGVFTEVDLAPIVFWLFAVLDVELEPELAAVKECLDCQGVVASSIAVCRW